VKNDGRTGGRREEGGMIEKSERESERESARESARARARRGEESEREVLLTIKR